MANFLRSQEVVLQRLWRNFSASCKSSFESRAGYGAPMPPHELVAVENLQTFSLPVQNGAEIQIVVSHGHERAGERIKTAELGWLIPWVEWRGEFETRMVLPHASTITLNSMPPRRSVMPEQSGASSPARRRWPSTRTVPVSALFSIQKQLR